MYSLHVVGLVFDGRERLVYLCDPNGALLPGGNMEMLALPWTGVQLPAGLKSTTAMSRYDRDRHQIESRSPAKSQTQASKRRRE